MNANETADVTPPRRVEPSLPRDVEQVLLHTLELDPDDRYGDLHALADELNAVLEHRPISLGAPSLREAVQKWTRRHRRGLAAAVILVALAIGLLLVNSVVRSLDERDRFVARLAEIPIDSANARGLHRAGLDLEALQDEFRSWDRRDRWEFLRRDVAPMFSEAIGTWWNHSRNLLNHGLALNLEQGLELQHRDWELVIDTALRVCPEGQCEGLGELRTRGKVFLPEGIDPTHILLLQQGRARASDGDLSHASIYEPIPYTERLSAGYYRALLMNEAETEVQATCEFAIYRPWDPGFTLEFRTPEPDVLATTLVPARVIREGMGPSVSLALPGVLIRIPEFRISEYVTVEAVRGIGGDEGIDLERFESNCAKLGLGPDDPAPAGRHHLALDIARAIGARLPTGFEVELALRIDAVPPVKVGLLGEMISDLMLGRGANPSILPYIALDSSAAPEDLYVASNNLMLWASAYMTSRNYVGMRFVFPGARIEYQVAD